MGVVDSPTFNTGVVGAYFVKTQLSEWVPADIARQLPGQHRHIWVRLSNSDDTNSSGWQATCRDCLCQCQLTAFPASVAEHGCIDQDGHHFHGTFSATPAAASGSCEGSTRCCKCGLCVTGALRAPALAPSAVQALERARQSPHAHHPTQGLRDLLATVSTLYKIAKNACSGDARPIRTDSERPRQLLKFDAPCRVLLEEGLGFRLRQQTEYHPPSDVAALSRVRDELALLVARVQRRLPEPERLAALQLEYVGEHAARWLGAHAYARRTHLAGLAILSSSGTAADDAYRCLGVPEDAADSVVAWAYRRLVEEDPETGGAEAQRRYDCLATISAARASAADGELPALVDAERDRGLVASAAVRAACGALFGDSQLDVSAVDADTLREVFLARLGDTHKTEARMELAAHLAILACAKRDRALESYAAEIKVSIEAQVGSTEKINTWAQLPIGLTNIGNTCYLNCMLQCLFSILPIREAVLRFGDGVTWNESCVLGRRDSGRLLAEDEVRAALKFVALLRALFEALIDRRVEAWAAMSAGKGASSGGHPLAALGSPLFPVVTPDRELADMLLRTPGSTNGSTSPAAQRSVLQQQDVDECMAQCVSLLDHALPPSVDNSSWIEQLLSGHLELTNISGGGGGGEVPVTDTVTETFVNLSLNLPPTKSSADINECLDAFFAPSVIPVSEDRGLLRSSRILDAPPVLCIQVQRVQFDMAKMRAFKINSHLRLRSQISLTRFTRSDHHSGDTRLAELRQKLSDIDQRLRTLDLPTTDGSGNVLDALERAQTFMSGVGQWTQLDAAQQLLADLEPQYTPESTIQCAQAISAQLESLSSMLNDSKRQWDLERAETVSEIDSIYEAVVVDSMAYTLHAVFIHSGMTPEFGHYWVYIRDYDRGQGKVRWLKFNDSYVTVVDDESEIFNKDSGDAAANPYYLMYVRSLDADRVVDLGV